MTTFLCFFEKHFIRNAEKSIWKSSFGARQSAPGPSARPASTTTKPRLNVFATKIVNKTLISRLGVPPHNPSSLKYRYARTHIISRTDRSQATASTTNRSTSNHTSYSLTNHHVQTTQQKLTKSMHKASAMPTTPCN